MSPEKANDNFEKATAQGTGNLDLQSDSLEGVNAAGEKISEVVGENANENISGGGQKSSTQNTHIQGDQSLKAGTPASDLVLPTPAKQKAVLQKTIEKRTNQLVKEVTKMQRSNDYSPAKLEEKIREIRYLRKVLAELANAALERIEELYRKLVWKK